MLQAWDDALWWIAVFDAGEGGPDVADTNGAKNLRTAQAVFDQLRHTEHARVRRHNSSSPLLVLSTLPSGDAIAIGIGLRNATVRIGLRPAEWCTSRT